MTIETLRQKHIGVLERRSFTIKVNNCEYKEYYSLVKGEDGRYFIGFSDDGTYCSSVVSEKYMVQLLNNDKLSSKDALDIYMKYPQLSCWLND